MNNQILQIQKKVIKTDDDDFIREIVSENDSTLFLGDSFQKAKVLNYIKKYKNLIICLPPKTGKTFTKKELINNIELYCSLSNDESKYKIIDIDFSPLKDFMFISFQYILDKFLDIIRISLDEFIENNINVGSKEYFLKEKDPINCLYKLVNYKFEGKQKLLITIDDFDSILNSLPRNLCLMKQELYNIEEKFLMNEILSFYKTLCNSENTSNNLCVLFGVNPIFFLDYCNDNGYKHSFFILNDLEIADCFRINKTKISEIFKNKCADAGLSILHFGKNFDILKIVQDKIWEYIYYYNEKERKFSTLMNYSLIELFIEEFISKFQKAKDKNNVVNIINTCIDFFNKNINMVRSTYFQLKRVNMAFKDKNIEDNYLLKLIIDKGEVIDVNNLIARENHFDAKQYNHLEKWKTAILNTLFFNGFLIKQSSSSYKFLNIEAKLLIYNFIKEYYVSEEDFQ